MTCRRITGTVGGTREGPAGRDRAVSCRGSGMSADSSTAARHTCRTPSRGDERPRSPTLAGAWLTSRGEGRGRPSSAPIQLRFLSYQDRSPIGQRIVRDRPPRTVADFGTILATGRSTARHRQSAVTTWSPASDPQGRAPHFSSCARAPDQPDAPARGDGPGRAPARRVGVRGPSDGARRIRPALPDRGAGTRSYRVPVAPSEMAGSGT